MAGGRKGRLCEGAWHLELSGVHELVSGHAFRRAEGVTQRGALAPEVIRAWIEIKPWASRTERELRRLFRITGLHWIFVNVLPVLLERSHVVDTGFGESFLPNPKCLSKFFLQSKRIAALDELHSPFNRKLFIDCYQDVEMISHDHELMEQIFSLRTVRIKGVNDESSIFLNLKQRSFPVRVRGNEESSKSILDVLFVRVSLWNGHNCLRG